MKYTKLLYLVGFVFLFTQCTQPRNYFKVLDESETLVYTKPNDVLITLDSILINPYLLNEKEFHRYMLLTVQAKDKAAKDIHLDTLIYKTRDFFVKKKDMRRAALASLYTGRVLMSNQKYEEAFQAFTQANEYASYFEDNNLRGLIYSSIGFLFTEQSLSEESRSYLLQALNYYLIDEDDSNIIICYNLLGNSYLFKLENDSAFFYYSQARNRAIKTQEKSELTYVNHSMALAFVRLGNLNEAEILFLENLSSLQDSLEISRTYSCLSDIYFRESNTTLAYEYISKAREWLPHDNSDLSLAISVFFKSAKILENLNLHDKALLYYKKYTQALSNYFSQNKNTAILELESRYKNEQLRSENKILVLSKQRNLLITSFIGVLVLSLLFYLVRRYLRNKKQLSIERKKRIEIERKIRETEVKIKQLQEMSLNFTEKENSFRNIVLHQFNILKKSADLDRYVKNNNVQELRLVKIFHKIVYKQEELNWDLLYNTMNELHDRFFDKLKDKYPTLSDQEFKICCLTYADFTSSEIGLILDLKLNTVQMKRSQIRKQIGMEPQENFKSFFNRYLI